MSKQLETGYFNKQDQIRLILGMYNYTSHEVIICFPLLNDNKHYVLDLFVFEIYEESHGYICNCLVQLYHTHQCTGHSDHCFAFSPTIDSTDNSRDNIFNKLPFPPSQKRYLLTLKNVRSVEDLHKMLLIKEINQWQSMTNYIVVFLHTLKK